MEGTKWPDRGAEGWWRVLPSAALLVLTRVVFRDGGAGLLLSGRA